MGEGNEGTPIFYGRKSDEEILWRIGPDGKYHCTPGGLSRAIEKWLEEIRKREEGDDKKIIQKKNQSLFIKDERSDKTPNLSLSPDLIKELTRMSVDEIIVLIDFLASLPPPPTSSSE